MICEFYFLNFVIISSKFPLIIASACEVLIDWYIALYLGIASLISSALIAFPFLQYLLHIFPELDTFDLIVYSSVILLLFFVFIYFEYDCEWTHRESNPNFIVANDVFYHWTMGPLYFF